jgi:hypothetical protein
MWLAAAFDQADTMSQVTFVHDYVQLVFQDLVMTIYSPIAVMIGATPIVKGDPTFCDRLVALIGSRVESVTDVPIGQLRLRFEGGIDVSVSLRTEDANGPEFFQIDRPGFPIIVEQVP